ncbi:MAG TPA: BMP family ABC transporter substrate-binding protein, partial [Acidimicrobiia bacterium]|nr:BMP family ABC transporter substrate-binding protein [Acidimicrobiia bacterium]
MISGRTRGPIIAMAVFALIVAACGSSSKSPSAGGKTTTSVASNGPWGWPGNATIGYLAPGEPDVNGDGKVTIGVISPGDTHDKGYYESFVDNADKFAADNGWKVVTVDKVPDSNAAQAARNMCQQHPDMVAIAASELKDAIPVASEPVCKDTVWYVAGGQGVTQTKFFVQTNDIESQSAYVSGVAAGMLMKAKGVT